MESQARQHGSRWKAASVVLGVVIVAAGFVGGMIGVGLWRGWSARVTPQERELLVVAVELEPLHSFVLRSDSQVFAKRRFYDGRTELAYHYDHPDADAPFQLTSRVIVAPNRAAGRLAYQELADGLDSAAQTLGLTFEERNQAFRWGDASRYGVLLRGEQVAGNVLACRRGEKVFFLELAGVGLDESILAELVGPSLQSLGELFAVSRILITSGPTRQYLDPVRYLTNASSGRMGKALAQAALDAGHDVIVVSGPVEVSYPAAAEVVPVISTEEMLEACRRVFPTCDGAICAAAPCDYRPEKVAVQKIAKTGGPLELHLIETPDVCATLGVDKAPGQWLVGFALETEDQRFRALVKLERKSCDSMVVNGPQAMNAEDNQVEIMDRAGGILAALAGDKLDVARQILQIVQERLIGHYNRSSD